MLDLWLEEIINALENEQEAGPCNDTMVLGARLSTRYELAALFQAIDAKITPLRQQFEALPALPNFAEPIWAHSILSMPNVVFFELATTDMTDNAEITQWAVVDMADNVLSHAHITPEKLSPEREKHIIGMTIEHAEMDLVLRPAWDSLVPILMGKYIIYLDDFTPAILKVIRNRYSLPFLPFVGDNLQTHIAQYFHELKGLSLSALCERLCDPSPATETTLDRAQAYIHILKAVAEGITDLRPYEPKRIERTPKKLLYDVDYPF